MTITTRRFEALFLFYFCAACSVLFGVPAMPGVVRLQQPDGTEISVRIVGDEYAHQVFNLSGQPLRQHPLTGFWEPQTLPEESYFKSSKHQKKYGAHARRATAVRPDLLKHTLVVLVEYTDVEFTIANPQQTFQRMLNEEGYSDHDMSGSARDYFRASSHGLFAPEFDVVGPVRLPHPMAYYGGTDEFGTNDARAAQMAIHACDQLDASLDFSHYDTDGDLLIDNVFIIYAGRGEASGGSASSVWPHSWNISDTADEPAHIYDGVRLDHYACTNELLGTDIAGIGTFVHEFSHVLGLPDLYATQTPSTAFTPGTWSVLDQGSYNNRGKTPPLFSAYERLAMGWEKPAGFSTPANVELTPVSEGGQARIIPTSKASEYYLIENRQQTSWDQYLPGHGLLVWHIDYSEADWAMNTVNNDATHQRVDLVEADMLLTPSTRSGDPFPGILNVRQITDDTTPALRAWNGQPLHTPLTSITERARNVYIKVHGGLPSLATPTCEQPDSVASSSFVARWAPIEGSRVAYVLSLFQLTPQGEWQPHPRYTHVSTDSACSLLLHHLQPATRYAYTIAAHDDFDTTAPSAPMEVTTLPLTFAESAPQHLHATPTAAGTCSISWDAVPEAEGYRLDIFARYLAEADTTQITFDSGASHLPQGWQTTSSANYGIAAYCGQAIPSLRLTPGTSISSPASKENYSASSENYSASRKNFSAFSFWHRAAADGAELLVEAQDYDEQWHTIATIPSTHDAGGTLTTLTDADALPADAVALRISLPADAPGSVAIDDILLLTGGHYVRTPISPYADYAIEPPISESRACLTLPLPAAEEALYFRVAATRGTERSLWSSDHLMSAPHQELSVPHPLLLSPNTQRPYLLSGRPARKGERGVVISHGNKHLQ